MKILFIWFGEKELSDYRKKCINRAMELYPKAEFFCLTNNPGIWPVGVELLDYGKYWKKIVDDYGNHPAQIPDYYTLGDHLRFIWCSEGRDRLYLDTDTYCVDPLPKLPKGKCGSVYGQLDVLYSNDKPEILEQVYQNRKKTTNLFYLKNLVNNSEKFINLDSFFNHNDPEQGYDEGEDPKNG